MPKADLSVIGKKNDPVEVEYSWKDVVLYALSVGATENLLFGAVMATGRTVISNAAREANLVTVRLAPDVR